MEQTLAPDGRRTGAGEIAAILDNARDTLLDVDSDGAADGVVIVRYLFGLRGRELVEGVLAPDADRTDPAEIEAFLDQFHPHAGGDVTAPFAPPGGEAAGEAVDSDSDVTPQAVAERPQDDDRPVVDSARRASLYRALAIDAAQSRAKPKKNGRSAVDEVDLLMLQGDW